ncbi:MAG: hypothetical protein IJ690_02590 [Clostridia bacterium]|nr:hypothetical protein [Clostridia bacterium]
MYVIRKISLNHLNGKTVVEKGIDYARLDNTVVLAESFWGLSKVNEHVPIKERKITYANNYIVEPYKFPRIKLILNVGLPDQVEGIILFVNLANDTVETDGKIIYQKRHQAVFVLQNGNYIKFGKKAGKIYVVNNELGKI